VHRRKSRLMRAKAMSVQVAVALAEGECRVRFCVHAVHALSVAVLNIWTRTRTPDLILGLLYSSIARKF
jgi:hypothetical protein